MTEPMTETAEELPKIQQTIRPSLRRDLKWIAYPKSHRWVLHDPISNAFYYFNDLERRAALLLDGSRTMNQVADTLAVLSTAKVPQPLWVESLANRLSASGLLMPSGRLVRFGRRSGRWKQFLFQIAANPLAIRIPVIRPSGHSPIAQSLAAILFHPWLVVVGCIAMAAVSFLLLAKWLSRPEQIFFDVGRLQGDRWLALLILLMGIKTLHEAGHYLACARWKVDCQEMGLMLLCFSPCFYCDTTNAWKLPSRWARAAISAGGIYVELWLAILGGLVYLNSDHALWRTLGAGTWVTCTLGTLLLNGNPCFRYDGYYILSDLWGVPNLGSQGQEALWRTFIGVLGGRRPERESFDKPIWQLVLFAVVSGVYRCMVVAALVWLVWTLLVPNGFGILALLIIGSLGVGLFGGVLRFARGLAVESLGPRPAHPARVATFLATMVALIAVALYIPIPSYVRSRGYVESKVREPLFLHDNAILTKIAAKPGSVPKDTEILECDSFELRKDWLQLKHRLDEVEIRIRLLEKAQINNEEAAFELPTLREVRDELASRFAIKQKEIDSLRVVTSRSGTLIPASIPRMMPFELGEPQWTRSPIFSVPPIGASLERGSVVGWLSGEDGFVFQAAVTADDVRWLTVGSRAEAVLDSQPYRRWPCTVTRIAPEPLQELPQPLLGDPSLIAVRDERGRPRFEVPHYQVVLEPDITLQEFVNDSAATVHFQLPGKTLFRSLSDSVRQGLQLP
jgi:putative peptide zinc metalloprotease protein